jgi:protein-tyrosine phosphatase
MKEIYWIRNDDQTRLAIVARPRGDDWLESDLSRLKNSGIDGVVSLLTEPEEEELGLTDELTLASSLGLSFFSFPIPDRTVPQDMARFSEFIVKISEEIEAGRALGIHCRGSIGRATITAASLLVQLGWKADVALEEIELARLCPVPDTAEQRTWILALRPPYSTR